MTLQESIQTELEQKGVGELEELCEWWMEHSYIEHGCESEREWVNRRAVVVPLVINQKLKIYEEEYYDTDAIS